MSMKTVVLALAGVFMVSPAVAQDLDEVLGNYYEAVGGLDAWKSVETMKMTGSIMMGNMGVEAPFVITTKRPKNVRLEFTFQGMTGVQAFDGETAWMLMPFMGKTEPEEMPADMAKEVIDQADLDGVLIGYEEEGHQLELVGMEETEGTEAYKIKVTKKNGDVEYYFLDSEYFIPIKVEGSREMQGRVVEFETLLSDYKDVGGLMMPHSLETKPKGAPAGQVITIETIDLNVPVEDSVFAMPETSTEGQP
jgi:hypothetical protein